MGAIQSSLNQLMLTTIGTGMAISHNPAIADEITKAQRVRNLGKKIETARKAEALGPTQNLETLRQTQYEAAQEAFDIAPSERTLQQLTETERMLPTNVPAYEGPADYYGSEDYQESIQQEADERVYREKREQDIQDLILGRQREALERKQNAARSAEIRAEILRGTPSEFRGGTQ